MRPSRQEGFARNDETAQADTVTERAADFLRSYRKLLSVEIIAIALLAALIGAFAGPFGTFDAMSLSERAVYWGLVSVVSILLGRTAFGLIALAGAEAGSVWEALGGAVLTAAFVTGGVWGVTQLFTHARPMTPDLPVLFVNVLLVTVGVVFLRQLVVRRGAKSAPPTVAEEEPRSDPEPEAAEGARPVLLRRLPEDAGETILHLSVCDHHVDVHTEKGTTSLRMRLADAIDAMDGVPGLRVHRSHWVAREAIDGVVRDQGRLFLSLHTGARVPVSRGARPVLEEAGLL